MNLLTGLYNYFSDCPLIDGCRLNIDYLPEDTKKTSAGVEYSLDTSPADEVITPYVDGGAHCQFVFVFRSVNAYGPNELQNMGNSNFFEDLTTWVRAQNAARKFPETPQGWQVQKVEVQSTQYLFSANADVGKYQIQCRLLYYRKGVR